LKGSRRETCIRMGGGRELAVSKSLGKKKHS